MKTNELKIKTVSTDESGNAGLVAILGIVAIIYLAKDGRTYFEGLDPVFYYCSLAILGTITFIAMGCSIHLRAIGSRPRRELVRDLQGQIKDIDALVVNVQKRMSHFETKMMQKAGVMSRRGVDCLGLLKKIIRALEKRNIEARRLIATGYRSDFFDAFDLISRKLLVAESALDSLIDSDPVPAIEPEEIVPAIERLMEEIENEIRRVA